jgi:hypothetical protein
MMDKIFQRIIDNNFSDLKGLTANAVIPISQQLINEIIETAIRGNRNIDSCQVSIHPQNRLSVNLRAVLLPLPLNLKLRIDKTVDLKNSPKVRATLENNLLLGALGSFFKGLPKGIEIAGNQVVVDIGAFLKPQQQRYFDWIKSAEIDTEEGKVILNVQVAVE